MKNLVFLFSLLVAMALVSCSKDNTPAPGQESARFDIPFSILVGANGSSTSAPQTKNLKDILSSANQDKVSYISVSTLNRTPSNISISGLPSGATLNSVTLATADKAINATLLDAFKKNPLVITRDTILGGDNYTDILVQIASYMATKKSITLTATCTAGNTNIQGTTVNLHIETTFSWQ